MLLILSLVFSFRGRFRTAGGGCWIKVPSCPGRTDIKHFFYDSLGAKEGNSDTDRKSCFSRAQYYWRNCGADPYNPVTAIYRPEATEITYP